MANGTVMTQEVLLDRQILISIKPFLLEHPSFTWTAQAGHEVLKHRQMFLCQCALE
jgi:hypothetical protein